jgi:hypothetical protein
MVNMLVSSVVDCGFEPRLGQTNDYKIGICCFSAKYTELRRKSKDWLSRNQNNENYPWMSVLHNKDYMYKLHNLKSYLEIIKSSDN